MNIHKVLKINKMVTALKLKPLEIFFSFYTHFTALEGVVNWLVGNGEFHMIYKR